MYIKLLAIAPYPGLGLLFTELAKDFPQIEITVVQADMEESLPILKRYEDGDFDFILSRGGTAKLLEKHTSIPVIEVQVSGYDILRILTLLKGQSKIQMIGFSNIIHSFEAVSTLIGMDIFYTVISHESEVEQALAEAKANGIQVIVGDSITVRLAKNIGLQGVLITSGRESVLEAFHIIVKMNRYISGLEAKNRHFNQLLSKIDDGMVVVDSEGTLLYSNPKFREMFHISSEDKTHFSIFEQYPYFNRFIERNIQDKGYNVEVNLFGKKYIVSANILPQVKDNSEEMYLIKFTNVEFREHGFYVRYPDETLGAFPQLIVTGKVFEESALKAKQQIDAKLPICIYGEKGSGKGLLITLLRSKLDLQAGNLIEIVIQNPTIASFQILLNKLESERSNAMIHLIGFENALPNLQRMMVEKLDNIKAQLIFSFTEDISEMSASFDRTFIEKMNLNAICIPPLRERLDEFEEFIRAFIFQFNEKYGKQIVGVQPKVLQVLKERQWKGNFYELSEVTEELVRLSEEDFIDEKSLSLLNIEEPSEGERNTVSSRINLNETLENIEKQVIQLVLEEENMNQSKAAKRLGINRSTLWRKLKDDEA